jgi:hypothetical protein
VSYDAVTQPVRRGPVQVIHGDFISGGQAIQGKIGRISSSLKHQDCWCYNLMVCAKPKCHFNEEEGFAL